MERYPLPCKVIAMDMQHAEWIENHSSCCLEVTCPFPYFQKMSVEKRLHVESSYQRLLIVIEMSQPGDSIELELDALRVPLFPIF